MNKGKKSNLNDTPTSWKAIKQLQSYPWKRLVERALFSLILSKIFPLKKIPAGVAERIKQIGNSDKDLESEALNILKHFAEKYPKTPIGAASKTALEN